MCNNPFGGPVGRILGVAGFKPSRKNPDLCTRCCDAVPHGGAEVDIAVLLADVRGSTTLGEQTPAADFATLLDRFYAAATQTLLRRDAVVDKLIGDEVMAFFVRGISRPDYRHQAVRAGLELLSAIGYGRALAKRGGGGQRGSRVRRQRRWCGGGLHRARRQRQRRGAYAASGRGRGVARRGRSRRRSRGAWVATAAGATRPATGR